MQVSLCFTACTFFKTLASGSDSRASGKAIDNISVSSRTSGSASSVGTHVRSRVCTPVSFSSTSSCDIVTGKKTILTSESDG